MGELPGLLGKLLTSHVISLFVTFVFIVNILPYKVSSYSAEVFLVVTEIYQELRKCLAHNRCSRNMCSKTLINKFIHVEKGNILKGC